MIINRFDSRIGTTDIKNWLSIDFLFSVTFLLYVSRYAV